MVEFISVIVRRFIDKFFLSYFLSVCALICTKIREEFGILYLSRFSKVLKAIYLLIHVKSHAGFIRRSEITSESLDNWCSSQFLARTPTYIFFRISIQQIELQSNTPTDLVLHPACAQLNT